MLSQILTPAELSTLRSDFETVFLTGSAIVHRSDVNITNAYGELTPAFTAAGTINARLGTFQKQRDQSFLGPNKGSFRMANRAWYLLSVEHDADVRDDDNIEFDGTVYEIVRIHDDHSERAFKRLTLVELEQTDANF